MHPAQQPLRLGRGEQRACAAQLAAHRYAGEVRRNELEGGCRHPGVGGDDVEGLVPGEATLDAEEAGAGGMLQQGIGPQVQVDVLLLVGLGIEFGGEPALGDHPMKAQAGDGNILVAAGEGVGLRLADPFRKRVGVFHVVGVLLVDGEIVEGAAKPGRFAGCRARWRRASRYSCPPHCCCARRDRGRGTAKGSPPCGSARRSRRRQRAAGHSR